MSPRRRVRKSRPPEAAWGILDRVFGKRGIKKRIKENRVFEVWDKAVGESIAANCRPLAVSEGVLTVEAKSNAWMQELSLLGEDLKREINAAMGWDAVKDLRFRVLDPSKPVSVPEAKAPARKKVKKPIIDARTAEEIDRYLDGIEDTELKEALRGLMARGITSDKYK